MVRRGGSCSPFPFDAKISLSNSSGIWGWNDYPNPREIGQRLPVRTTKLALAGKHPGGQRPSSRWSEAVVEPLASLVVGLLPLTPNHGYLLEDSGSEKVNL